MQDDKQNGGQIERDTERKKKRKRHSNKQKKER